MPDISRQELTNLLNSEDLGQKAYFLSIVTSWLNLRVIDSLFDSRRATAGEIAREINADMSDVADSLRELQSVGIVSSEKSEKMNATYWRPAVSEISIDLLDESGLQIKYSIDGVSSRRKGYSNPQTNSGHSQITSLGQLKDAFVKFSGQFQSYIEFLIKNDKNNPSSNNSIHTVLDGDKWTNRVGTTKQGRYSTREEAADIGREIAKRNQSEYNLHDRDGRIEERRSYKN